MSGFQRPPAKRMLAGDGGAAARDGVGVSNASVDADGVFEIRLTDGRAINLGNIKGKAGDAGVGYVSASIDEAGVLSLVDSTGAVTKAGEVRGKAGKNGDDGVSIANAMIDGGDLVLALTDGRRLVVGKVVGDNGQDGRGFLAAWIDDGGCLFLTDTLGETISLGRVRGKDGVNADQVTEASVDPGGYLVMTFASGREIQVGRVRGEKGDDGKSFVSATVDDAGRLVLVNDAGEEVIAGVVRGKDAADAVSISGGEVDAKGDLFLRMTDGCVLNAGSVRGGPGRSITTAEINEHGHLILGFSDGSSVDAGLSAIPGKDGKDAEPGQPGVGVERVHVEGADLIVVMTDGTTINAGHVAGPPGKRGDPGIPGKMWWANGRFSRSGDAQIGWEVLRGETVGAVSTILTMNGAAPDGANLVVVPDNTAILARCTLVARCDAGRVAGATFDGLLSRNKGVTTWLQLSREPVPARVSATTAGALQIEVVGAENETAHWLCRIDTAQVG